MGQFLRFATLIVLVLIGFGSGICGLFGLGATALDSMQRRGGGENFAGVVVMFSVVGLVVAVVCFFAVRALARSLRAHASPAPGAVAPPVPPSPPPGPPSRGG
jgi:hypothetical protein